MSDEQDQAESLDEDVIDDIDDYGGDEYGDGLPAYPPERPLGLERVGTSGDDSNGTDSYDERTWREEPDVGQPGAHRPARVLVGQIADPYAAADEDRLDHEAASVARAVGGYEDGPEAAALHLEG